jgi:hypothetical protein
LLPPRPAKDFHLQSSAHARHTFTALQEGRPGEAAPWFAKAAQANGGAPHSYFAQAVALALDGCAGEGRALLKHHVDGSPTLYCEMFAQTGMIRELVAKLAEGARLLEAAN